MPPGLGTAPLLRGLRRSSQSPFGWLRGLGTAPLLRGLRPPLSLEVLHPHSLGTAPLLRGLRLLCGFEDVGYCVPGLPRF